MCRVPDGLPLPLAIFRAWFLVFASVAFIEPLHANPVPAAVEEFIYPAMEDFRIDVPVDSGLSARTVQIPLPAGEGTGPRQEDPEMVEEVLEGEEPTAPPGLQPENRDDVEPLPGQ